MSDINIMNDIQELISKEISEYVILVKDSSQHKKNVALLLTFKKSVSRQIVLLSKLYEKKIKENISALKDYYNCYKNYFNSFKTEINKLEKADEIFDNIMQIPSEISAILQN